MSSGAAGQDFERFVEHAYWGLDKIVSALEALGPERWTDAPVEGLRSPREIMVHICWGFENFWGACLRGEALDGSPPLDPASFSELASLLEAWRPVQAWWRDHTAGLTDEELERSVAVTWMDGSVHTPPSRHILS